MKKESTAKQLLKLVLMLAIMFGAFFGWGWGVDFFAAIAPIGGWIFTLVYWIGLVLVLAFYCVRKKRK